MTSKTKTLELNEWEWVEVYYALNTKCINLKRGNYGMSIDGQLNIDEWVSQLTRIQEKIQNVVKV